MYRVIDTIQLSKEVQQRLASSGVLQLGNGLLAILDPAQIKTAPMAAGRSVRIYRPDGRVTEQRVTSVEVQHSVVGLFFADTKESEIPRLSQIELVEVV